MLDGKVGVRISTTRDVNLMLGSRLCDKLSKLRSAER